MRHVPAIWEAWRSGVYVGDTKPCTRVTVEKSFWLRTTEPVVGQWHRGPARWFQRADLDEQVETEVPNVLSVNIERSIESDAGTCDITLANLAMPTYGEPDRLAGEFGTAGFYTWDHGVAQDARARWNHAPNAWNGVFTPNALIRTYQGFGGHDKPLDEAIADGNVVLNGVWLVDDVNVNTDGTLQIQCRDMAKLLLDQQLYPPLVPTELYPPEYRRWITTRYDIPPDPPPGAGACHNGVYGVGTGPHSSTDEVYGQFNSAATGHRPGDAFDISSEAASAGPGQIAHQATLWLSEPKAGPGDHVWIEFGTGDGIIPLFVNRIYYHAWGGNYLVLVSVFENGEWVPPEMGGQGGMTPEGIPYVSTFSPVWEGGQPWGLHTNQYPLPRDYHASKIRLTITNLIKAPEGGYRAGARKIMACFDEIAAVYPVLMFAGASMPRLDGQENVGYWQARSNGRVFAFGDARIHNPTSNPAHHATAVIAMTAHPSGNGYWTLDISGRVVSFGSAAHYGDLEGERDDAVDIAPTPTGDGYWLLAKDGTVYTYGDAAYFGNATVSGTMPSGAPVIARSIESHPETQGYWVLRTDGNVQAFNLTDHGDAARTGLNPIAGGGRTAFEPAEYVASIRRTSTGGGYWITSGGGTVQGFGDVGIVQGTPKGATEAWATNLCWDLIPASGNDAAYAIVKADGRLIPIGNWASYGSAGEGAGTTRIDGNYKDYADVIRDLLLWAGFYLYRDPQPGSEMPDVYGNIENTGIHGETDPLPLEMFNKRPVIEAINDLKRIVGYLFYVDSEGGARWESPNWWMLGNFLMDGTPYPYMPEIDETVQLLSHGVTFSSQAARSEITISSRDPYPIKDVSGEPVVVTPIATGLPSTPATTTTIIPTSAADLRGLIVPAAWANGVFLNPVEQRIMADLIAMQIWFTRRRAQVSCVANPLIDINDQVRVIERQTGEVYIHYVRGASITHDLNSGEFTMTLDTHWMGGTPYGQTPFYFATAMRPQGDGYWQVNAFGGIYAFGAADVWDSNEADSHLTFVISMRSTLTGDGHYTLDTTGKVLTYGDAVYHGSLFRSAEDITDMALTPSGNGYWILRADGTVTEFGDAIHYGNATVTGNMPSGSPVKALSIENHPVTQGYRILLSNGDVQAFNLAAFGDANRDGYDFTEYTSCLRRTASGNGYWIVSGGGLVQAFGDAPDHGDGERYPDERWAQGLVWDILVDPDDGYALQHADGHLDFLELTDLGQAISSTDPAAIDWPIVTEGTYSGLTDPAGAIPVSLELMRFLQGTGSPSANNAVANNFGNPSEPTIKAR